MQHGSRNDSGRPLGSSVGLLVVTTVAVLVVTAWLVSTNLYPNLCCYLFYPASSCELDVPPPSDVSAVVEKNLQLVHIPQSSHLTNTTSTTFGKKSLSSSRVELTRLVYEADESACADKVDNMRLDSAFRERVEKLGRLILSTSRVSILKISYHHQNHNRNNSKLFRKSSQQQSHAFLSNSTSNKKEKNVPDADTCVVESTKNRFNIINSSSLSHDDDHHPFFTLPVSADTTTTARDLPLDNFSPSLSSDSSPVPFMPFMSNAKLESTFPVTIIHTSYSSSPSFSNPKPIFNKESLLLKYPELMVRGHMALISDR
jgi:hypothetical protein